jgi:integrase
MESAFCDTDTNVITVHKSLVFVQSIQQRHFGTQALRQYEAAPARRSRYEKDQVQPASTQRVRQLLLRLLATTGMRLSEALEIDSEMKEGGVRYVMVDKKTEQSLRRVLLPASALPYLPKKITGPLFVSKHADPPDMASKRLGRFLDDIGITDPRKVVHSLRHRAQDRLRAAACPEDIRWALLGHEEKTVAAGYGEGFPVPMLKKWIDRIGA